MKRIQLLTRVEPDLRDRVSQMASEEGISINDLVIKALESYLGIPQDRSDNTIDNSTAITSLEERITALESNAIKVDNSTAITMDIADRFEALEREIQAIKEQLGAIVDAGKLPPKTAPKKEKTIAPGGTIAKINWKSFIAEFPGKTLDELCQIARDRYPDRNPKTMRDSINRVLP